MDRKWMSFYDAAIFAEHIILAPLKVMMPIG
jgi:hypothetical protein